MYSLKENEEGMYHLLLTERFHIPQDKRYEDKQRIVKVSKRDFAQYKKPETQKCIGWAALEILHDPTIKPIPIEKPTKKKTK